MLDDLVLMTESSSADLNEILTIKPIYNNIGGLNINHEVKNEI